MSEVSIYTPDGELRLFIIPSGEGDGFVYDPAGNAVMERKGNFLVKWPQDRAIYEIVADGLVYGITDDLKGQKQRSPHPYFTTIDPDDFSEHWER
ncbi:hypothetical protein E0H35_25660 [Rhizobium leguminosarum bv. viciae]|uniref:hypothetical protein n=1 Tax=Rhizobium leguminosarum TaxID=384 RepID=UPI00103BAB95|nr:hypothetical protein [Rhizobium leguminosarum]TBY93583.1 hypothetical protein E0H35_25660 [Rhizobium leguminosarum bv. viciae]